MEKLIEVIFIFVIYSFVGWVLESVYKSVLQKKIVNSGFLIGPFCPIYGYGAIIMYYCLIGLKNDIFLLFISSFVILSIWEYIVGWLLEIVFKTKYWDYSNKFLNIGGRVCLLNSIFWGVLGVLFIKLIHPFICNITEKIPSIYVAIFLIISIIYIVTDTIITAVNIIRTNIKLDKLEEVQRELKKRVVVMNDIVKHKEYMNRRKIETNIERVTDKISDKLDELELRRDELAAIIEKRTKRIRNAFPSMDSDRIKKALKLNNSKDIK